MDDAPLTPTRLERLQTLFELVLDLPPADRSAALATHAPGDHGIQAEVLALVRAHERGESEFRSPVSGSAFLDGASGEDRRVGTRIGAYRVTRLVGVGGMGAVYEATRADEQYEKRVAVKFLHRHADTAVAAAQFRAERQILASLDHPNIATLLDGGVTDAGQPYLVMEYVDGQPITRWCDDRRLPTAERVALFLQVCDAVQSAHQNLVVHRDLKPGNVLVTADGRVKLLDFGIARLLRPEDGSDLPPTLSGHRSFTPEYAAPEQMQGRTAGTTTDIYSLGVILFELLAGRRPFDLADCTLAEFERIVLEQAPPRPSAVIDGGRAPLLGERSVARARSRVAGDLDAIIGVALRKEPGRRYGSADLLARDLRRHLDGRAVAARPDGAAYRLRKLIGRRKLASAAIAAAAIFLVGGMVTTRAQARRAEAESRRAAQVSGFLATMLGSADPASLGRDVTVREVLDSAAVRADTLRGTPSLEAEVRSIIGGTYVALGEFEAGEAQFRGALAAHAARAPAGDYSTAVTLTHQSNALEFLGRYAEADSVLRLAATLFQRYPHTDPLDRIDFLDQRARIVQRLGDNVEGERLLQEALDLTIRHAPGVDSNLAYAYVNLGFAKSELGKAEEAESLYAAGVAAAQRAYGNEHPVVASMLSPYASVLDRAGRTAEADSIYRAVIAMRRRLLGPEHPDYAWTLFNYADFHREHGRYAEAARWAREVLKLRGPSLPETHPAVATAMGVLGRALGRMDSLAAGERWLRESLALREKALPAGHWLLASSRSILGEHLALSGRFAEAEALMLPAERALVEIRGEDAPPVRDARARLAALYAAWGKPDEAARWQASTVAPAGAR